MTTIFGVIKDRTMKNEKVTANTLKTTLAMKGCVSDDKKEKVIQRLQVTGSLIVILSDVLDTLFNDEVDMFSLLDVNYKYGQKMHKNMMLDAVKKYHYHMAEFTKGFFMNKEIQADMEDHSQDIYDIIKLLADHTNNHNDMEVIKRNLRRRKLNHHIFD